VVYVIGANDVTNRPPRTILVADLRHAGAGSVEIGHRVVQQTLLASGYAGIDNPLFYRDNTMMVLGDAKKMTEEIAKSL
jgi:NAD(P) transhydrogenase subunit beta